jgi:ferredoxin
VTAPDIEEKPYKIIFEGKGCIGSGKCAEVSQNWGMNLETGLAQAGSHYIDESELEHNIEAARVCPARNGDGVITVVDRRTGEELDTEP